MNPLELHWRPKQGSYLKFSIRLEFILLTKKKKLHESWLVTLLVYFFQDKKALCLILLKGKIAFAKNRSNKGTEQHVLQRGEIKEGSSYLLFRRILLIL